MKQAMVGGYFLDVEVRPPSTDVDLLDDHDVEAPEVVIGEDQGSSAEVRSYFLRLEEEARRIYALAEMCRKKGFDPETFVEIPPAIDLASRVEELMRDYLPKRGVAERIRELSRERHREAVALEVAREVAQGRFGSFPTRERALEVAIRVGLAIVTEGILVAPLEGIAGVRILPNPDGTECVAISYAGPIRAAGGTGQALSVLLADIVRRDLGIGRYVPLPGEVDRWKEEIPAYKNAQHLQYTPTPEEIEIVAQNCPVMIDGEGTEEEEVSGNRDLPRLETNRLRGGACLVLAEGLILKAPKVQKHVRQLGLDGWEFLEFFAQKRPETSSPTAGEKSPIEPNPKYMQELVAGRPVFAHPSRKGGFRLRYGRSRTAGLASTSVHPATMVVLEEFLAVGTQMKIERPGKATVATPCESLDGPLVLLHDGSLVEITQASQAREWKGRIHSIVDLGEILVPFGEFLENNKPLPSSPYVVEWWEEDVLSQGKALPYARPLRGPAVRNENRLPFPSSREAVEFAERTGTPLHPQYTLFWHDVTIEDLRFLAGHLLEFGRFEEGSLVVPLKDERAKSLLEDLGALHTVRTDPSGAREIVVGRHSYALLRGLGLDLSGSVLVRRRVVDPSLEEKAPPRDSPSYPDHMCRVVSSLSGFTVRPRSPWRIGARMGRPEKAAPREMSPPVHVLFPIGEYGGPQRLVKDASRVGSIVVEISLRICPSCSRKSIHWTCPSCSVRTRPLSREGGRGKPEAHEIPLGELLEEAQNRLKVERLPAVIKGVQGLISKSKSPEPLEKGILRALHGVTCFKDGTIRFDMTDVPLTHFRPREIHTPLEKLHALGYTRDIYGEPLTSEDQLLELKVQDLVVPEGAMEHLFKSSKFIDDLLSRFYGVKPFYDASSPEDLVGHLVVGLAPHTSGGVLGRIVGYTKAQVGWAHPFFHAAKRRNADGDEDCILLLLDALLNFSRTYLPDNRGGLMDAPLTLTLRIDPREVDKEAHNVDVLWRYPREFYEATLRHPNPREVETYVETVARRLGTPAQYEGFGFTHDTGDIAGGPTVSAYKSIEEMMGKIEAQLALARKIRAVDDLDVANRVVSLHLLPDLLGNLKAFSKQKVRCTKCSAKYRRIPLKGVCLRCGNSLTMTVHEKSVRKYLEATRKISSTYRVTPYTLQRIEHVEESIESLFSNDRVKKSTLSDFFS